MSTRTTHHLGLLVPVAAAVLMIVGTTSCAPVPSGVKTGSTQACAPIGQVVHEIDINVVSAPPGSSIDVSMGWEYKDHSDAGGLNYGVTDPVAGATYRPPFRPDPGLCLWVSGNNGLQYTTAVVPETDLATIFAFYFINPIAIMRFTAKWVRRTVTPRDKHIAMGLGWNDVTFLLRLSVQQ